MFTEVPSGTMKALVQFLALIILISCVNCIWWRKPARTTEKPKLVIRSQPLLDPPAGENFTSIVILQKINFMQVKYVVVVTSKEEGVVLQRILVMKEKETVMVLLMGVVMMGIKDVKEI